MEISNKPMFGPTLSNYLARTFTDGAVHKNVEFVRISKKPLIKLNKLNGKQLYSFSKDYHKKLQAKLKLEDDYEYYIYEDDIKNFEKMTAEEQLDYLNLIEYDGTVIGYIKSSDAQKLFQPLLKLNTPYTITINYSQETASNWWILDDGISDIQIALWSKPLVGSFTGLCMKIPHKKVEYKPYITFEETTRRALMSLCESNLFKYKIEEDRDKHYDYYLKIHIFGVVKTEEDSKFIHLFSVYYKTIYSKANIFIFYSKLVQAELQSKLKLQFLTKSEQFKNALLSISEDLKDVPKYAHLCETIETVANAVKNENL